MKVLVAVASKHGSTREIATRLVERLEGRGHLVHDVEIGPATHVPGYDAYVVGSAVYAGRWLKAAREFLHDHATDLRGRPVWLFSSGPLGEHADQDAAVAHPEQLVSMVDALAHHVFSGRMIRDELGAVERLVAGAVHAPEGDFRDWHDVDVWADSISDELDRRETATSKPLRPPRPTRGS
jgi:menaquinone-dependent protoporphyrinogen oxidase